MIERWRAHQEREDYRSGLIASILVNVNRKKGAKKAKPMDFYRPSEGPEPDHEDPQQARREFFAWVQDNSKHGGVIIAKS